MIVLDRATSWWRTHPEWRAAAPGLAVALVGRVGFAVLLDSVQEHDDVTVLDEPVLSWLVAHRSTVMTAVFGAVTLVSGPVVLPVLVAIGWVPGLARMTRGITLEATTREFVQAAEVLGYRRRTILFGEILPNLTTPLMVEFGLRLTWSIGLIAGLSFLGFGAQPPTADWGLMVNENRNGIGIQPWAVLVPVALIAVFAIATNLVTEGFARTMAGIDRRSDT